MSFKKMIKDELELLSYTDITNLILEENGEQTTAELFKIIVDKLELGKNAFENKIGNYYTSLTTDQRFVLLDSGKWDLRVKHPITNIIIPEDDDLDDIIEDDIEDIIEEEEEEKEKDYSEYDNDDEEDVASEYKNLVIVDEEDLNTLE